MATKKNGTETFWRCIHKNGYKMSSRAAKEVCFFHFEAENLLYKIG